MKPLFTSALLVIAGTLSSMPASAHEGHHKPGFAVNVWHLLTAPDHLLVLVAFMLPVSIAFALIRLRKAKQLKLSK